MINQRTTLAETPRRSTVDHFVAASIATSLIVLTFTAVAILGVISGRYDISFLGAYLPLILINYRLGHSDVFYPGFLYSVLWLATLTLLVISPIDVDVISAETACLLFGCCVMFSLGCFAVSHIPVARTEESQARLNDLGGRLLIAWLIAMLPLFVLDITKAAGGFGPDLLARARIAIINLFLEGKTPFSSVLTSTAPSIAVMACLASAIDRTRTNKWITRTLITLALLYAILTTGRPQVVQIVLGLGCIYLFGHRPLRFVKALKKAVIPLSVGATLLVLVPIVTKVEATRSASATAFAGQLFLQYLIGSVPALDTLIVNPVHFASTLTYHPLVLAYNYIFGTHSEELTNWFVYVPFPMNTFTAYRPYLFDFGLIGPVVFSGVIGMFHGILYRKARRGSDLFLFFFAVYLYPLVMTIFDDQYTGGVLIHHIQVILFAALYFGVLRDLSKKKLVTLLVGRTSFPNTSRFH